MKTDVDSSSKKDPYDASRYRVQFNAPAMKVADIGRVPGINDSYNNVYYQTRDDVIARKGWMIPDTTYTSDWSDNSDEEPIDTTPDKEVYEWAMDPRIVVDPVGFWGDAFTSVVQSVVEATVPATPKTSKSTMFPDGIIYGFRFMYNPTTLDFNVGTVKGVNTAYIFSGKSQAAPASTGTGSGISVRLTISRVDDLAYMAAMDPIDAGSRMQQQSDLLERYTTVDSTVMYGGGTTLRATPKTIQPSTSSVTLADLKDIAARGTMYDLEFLFRSVLGRKWKTEYRGYTADVGMAFSVPLILCLSPTMIYRVRLTSLQYTHQMFTPDMIPIVTQVNLYFERIPDVISTSASEGDGADLERPSGIIWKR